MVASFPGELVLESISALVAGLLLNFTPCVLPAIPIKIRTILHHAGDHPARRIAAGAAFVAGSLLFFLALGIVTATLHWTWGNFFESRWFLITLIGLLSGFALCTFIDVRLPVPQFAQQIPGGRYLEPLASGAFSALLASSCTGPFLGGVLMFAIAHRPVTIISLFALIGLGLGLPYFFLLWRPELLQRLPRSGVWSKRIRQAMAFGLFAGAVFFTGSLVSSEVTYWLWITWIATLVVWALYVFWVDHSRAAKIVAALAVAVGVIPFHLTHLSAPADSETLHWVAFSNRAITQARLAHRPLLLEFTAAWCINCQVLENTVYTSAPVVKSARRNKLVALRADLTRPNRQLELLLRKDGGDGLPYAVVISNNGTVVKRFSGLFTAQALELAIQQAGQS